MDQPALFTGVGALVSAFLAFLRGETRFQTMDRRIDGLDAELTTRTAGLMPRELCSERVKRIEEGQTRVEGEVAQLRKDVTQGFRDVKALIRNGGNNGRRGPD